MTSIPSVPEAGGGGLTDQGRKAAVVAICEQEAEGDMGYTLGAMRRPLEALGYEIVGELPVYAVFDRGKVKENRKVLGQASTLGRHLADALRP